MKRSAQPLPSGAATNDGLERMPRKRSSPVEMVAEVLAAVVVAQAEPGGDARPVAAGVRPQPLAERLELFGRMAEQIQDEILALPEDDVRTPEWAEEILLDWASRSPDEQMTQR